MIIIKRNKEILEKLLLLLFSKNRLKIGAWYRRVISEFFNTEITLKYVKMVTDII